MREDKNHRGDAVMQPVQVHLEPWKSLESLPFYITQVATVGAEQNQRSKSLKQQFGLSCCKLHPTSQTFWVVQELPRALSHLSSTPSKEPKVQDNYEETNSPISLARTDQQQPMLASLLCHIYLPCLPLPS
ncbi:unnamed protein product [Eretmochelys imbricata]